MFEGQAEKAMAFYVSLFDDARIENITRYGADAPEHEGKVVHASFSLAGQNFMCSDSTIGHDFGFTPAMSIFVTCRSEDEIVRLFDALSEGGDVLMPLDRYPFALQFAWIADRFGVSWQLMLPPREAR